MGQDIAIFDDFHAGWFKLTDLIRLFDSTPMLVAPKGDQVPFTSSLLVFTSNVDPRDWYSGYKGRVEHKDALERRIQEFATIVDCTVSTVETVFGSSVRRVRTPRTETFKFRDDFGDSFGSLDLGISAGVGDMSQGNGYF